MQIKTTLLWVVLVVSCIQCLCLPNTFAGRPLSGLIGKYYLITDKIIWDAGVEVGMNKVAPDYRITTGLTLLFKP